MDSSVLMPVISPQIYINKRDWVCFSCAHLSLSSASALPRSQLTLDTWLLCTVSIPALLAQRCTCTSGCSPPEPSSLLASPKRSEATTGPIAGCDIPRVQGSTCLVLPSSEPQALPSLQCLVELHLQSLPGQGATALSLGRRGLKMPTCSGSLWEPESDQNSDLLVFDTQS